MGAGTTLAPRVVPKKSRRLTMRRSGSGSRELRIALGLTPREEGCNGGVPGEVAA